MVTVLSLWCSDVSILQSYKPTSCSPLYYYQYHYHYHYYYHCCLARLFQQPPHPLPAKAVPLLCRRVQQLHPPKQVPRHAFAF